MASTRREESPNRNRFFPSNEVLSPLGIIFSAHRFSGANFVQKSKADPKDRLPENSIASLKRALYAKEILCIEFDLHLSSKMHLMVIHGHDLSATARYIAQKGDKVIEQHKLAVGTRINISKDKSFVGNFDVKTLQNRFDISNGFTPANASLQEEIDYRVIPTFQEVLELISIANAWRKNQGIPAVILNIELKGVGTGAYVKQEIDHFNQVRAEYLKNYKKQVLEKIDYKDIYYLSFLPDELHKIALRDPKAKLILGIPSGVQYKDVNEKFHINDLTQNTAALDKLVGSLDDQLKSIKERNTGLSGVDMSFFDVMDSTIDYFSAKKLPIHVAVLPFAGTDFASSSVNESLKAIIKTYQAQRIALEKAGYTDNVLMLVKTDDPFSLSEALKKHISKGPVQGTIHYTPGRVNEVNCSPFKPLSKPGQAELPKKINLSSEVKRTFGNISKIDEQAQHGVTKKFRGATRTITFS